MKRDSNKIKKLRKLKINSLAFQRYTNFRIYSHLIFAKKNPRIYACFISLIIIIFILFLNIIGKHILFQINKVHGIFSRDRICGI